MGKCIQVASVTVSGHNTNKISAAQQKLWREGDAGWLVTDGGWQPTDGVRWFKRRRLPRRPEGDGPECSALQEKMALREWTASTPCCNLPCEALNDVFLPASPPDPCDNHPSPPHMHCQGTPLDAFACLSPTATPSYSSSPTSSARGPQWMTSLGGCTRSPVCTAGSRQSLSGLANDHYYDCGIRTVDAQLVHSRRARSVPMPQRFEMHSSGPRARRMTAEPRDLSALDAGDLARILGWCWSALSPEILLPTDPHYDHWNKQPCPSTWATGVKGSGLMLWTPCTTIGFPSALK